MTDENTPDKMIIICNPTKKESYPYRKFVEIQHVDHGRIHANIPAPKEESPSGILIIGGSHLDKKRSRAIQFITERYASIGQHISVAHAESDLDRILSLGEEKRPIDIKQLIKMTPPIKEPVFEKTNYKGYIPCPNNKKRRRKR